MILGVFLGTVGAGAADGPVRSPADKSVKHVDAKQAQSLLADKKVVVLDIRTPEEYQEGRIAGATNINFQASDFEQKIAALDKSKTYLVHCASGGRSKRSLPVFEKLQFQSIYHLDGGIIGWEKAGFPVKKGDPASH